jgi:hypothetical protein
VNVKMQMEQYDSLLGSCGVSLGMPGIYDIALTRDDALRAVELLRASKVAIFGGDVYFRRATGIELAYAFWSANPKPGEEEEAYRRRSWETSEAYIKGFPPAEGAEPLFVIVTPHREK